MSSAPASGETLVLGIAHYLATIVLILTLVAASSSSEEASFCGNAQFDRRNLVNDTNNQTVPEIFRKKHFSSRRYARFGASNPSRLQKLASTPFPVRIRAMYDAAFEADFDDRNELEIFVRNLLLATQMIYERPEMQAAIKLYFVVVRLEKLKREFPVEFDTNDILFHMHTYQGPSASDDYDMTFLLSHAHIFDKQNGPKASKLLGMSSSGTFCDRGSLYQGLIFKAVSPNNGIVAAHEFAHSLNVQHDGEPYHYREKWCTSHEFIMDASANIGRDSWSKCSVEAMQDFLSSDRIFGCVYDERRFRTEPINERFNFLPSQSREEPGQQLSANRQCQLSFDKSVMSATLTGYDICKMLWCSVDGDLIAQGPALPGTSCHDRWNQPGRCRDGNCVPHP